jgi:hypothetical protein
LSLTRSKLPSRSKRARRSLKSNAQKRTSRRHSKSRQLHIESLEARQLLANVVISEILASNDLGLQDYRNDSSDWVELQNNDGAAVDLSGWYLTDNASNLTKWQFPVSTVVNPGEQFVLFASGRDTIEPNDELHTNFQLASAGDYLALVEPNGLTIADQITPTYPVQAQDVSYGVFQNNTGFMSPPTPGAPNQAISIGVAETPTFSLSSQSFTGSLSVELSTAAAGHTIRYTLDESVPNASSPIYSAPLSVTESTQIRAISFATDMIPSDVVAENYNELNADVLNFRSDLPVIVIDTFNQNLPNNTVRTSSFALFEPNPADNNLTSISDTPTVESRSSIKVRGSSSAGFTKQNFAVELWEDGLDVDESHSLLGMPKEGDWILHAPDRYDRSLINNAFIYQVSNEAGRYAVQTRFVELFLNKDNREVSSSDYYGVYVLMEKIEQDSDRVGIEEIPIQATAEPDVSGGYIFKVDRADPGGDGGFNATSNNGQNQNVKYVEPKETDVESRPAQQTYVADYWNKLTSAIEANDFHNPSTGLHYSEYIDVGSFVDHHLLNELMLNVDAMRLSAYYHKDQSDLLAAGPLWDFDRTAESADGRDDQPTTWYMDIAGVPWWWAELFTDHDYRQQWVDRWQELREDLLSDEHINSIVDSMATELLDSSVRNNARWTGSGERPRTSSGSPVGGLDGTFLGEINHKKLWFEARTAHFDAQFLAKPTFDLPGGIVAANSIVTLSSEAGSQIYYTLDGTDPRAPGGGVAGNAVLYSAPLLINDQMIFTARTFDASHNSGISDFQPGNEPWSGPIVQSYVLDAPPIRITEINYNPTDPTTSELSNNADLDNDDFEFIELTNAGNVPIDFLGTSFSDGVTFSFDSPLLVNPGEHVLLVANQDAFEIRYGVGLPVVGQYTGSLSNNSEGIILVDSTGSAIHNFQYDDNNGWPARADGRGSTLEVIDTEGNYDDPANWQASSELLGSPGVAGTGYVGDVVINEVLSHTDLPLSDTIELFNTTNDPIDIGGWFISDTNNDFFMFEIPDATILLANDYLLFDEDDFNSSLGIDPKDFALNGAHGDELILTEVDGSGDIVRFADAVAFGAQKNGESWARSPNGTGVLYPAIARTLDNPNGAPRIGPVVLNEIAYHPQDPGNGILPANLEFVELYNTDTTTTTMTGWRLRGGIDFDFADNFMFPSETYLVIVPFDPDAPADAQLLADFQSTYGIDNTITLVGPFSGQLGNGGEALRLQRPDSPPLDEPAFTPRLLEDRTFYDDVAPWPTGADGLGHSISRIDYAAIGDYSTSWQGFAPSPGFEPAPAVSNVTSPTPNGNYTLGDTIEFSLHFSEDVTAVSTPRLSLDMGGVERFADYQSGNGSTLTFSYQIQAGDINTDLSYTGTDALTLNGGTIRNATLRDASLVLPIPGDLNSLSFNKDIHVDAAPPTFNVTRNGASPTASSSVAFSVDFVRDVFNVDAADFGLDLSGVTADATVVVDNAGDNDDSTYNVTVNNVAGFGTLGLLLDGGNNIADAIGIPSSVAATVNEEYIVDTVPPTFVVTRDASNPTIATSVAFSIDFIRAVENVDASDFSIDLVGLTSNPNVVVTDASDNDDATYRVTVSSLMGFGTVGLSLVGGNDITNTVGIPVNVTPTVNQVYTVDTEAPTFAITRADPNPTSATSVAFHVNFDRDVNNVSAADFGVSLSGVTAGSRVVSNAGDSDRSTYIVTVNTISGTGTLGLRLVGGNNITNDFGVRVNTVPTVSEVYNIDTIIPAVSRFELNADLADPADLDGQPQPTSWAVQRSEIVNIQVEFTKPVDLEVGDITLTNLGLNPAVDPDQVIAITANQLDFTGNVATLSFAIDDITSGVYEMRISSDVVDSNGDQLDGNGDGTVGDDYVISGNTTNRFYRMKSDHNGDGGTSVFDFTTFSYWFGQSVPQAPLYADMNGDDGVSVFDFTSFSSNFGLTVTLPVAFAARAIVPAAIVEPTRTVDELDDDIVQVEPIRPELETAPLARRDTLDSFDDSGSDDFDNDDLELVLDEIADSVALNWNLRDQL